MRKILTFLFAALMSVGMWATTVTWNNSDLPAYDVSFSKDGVMLNCDEIYDGTIWGPGTFTSSLGNFTKIEIIIAGWNDISGEGWSGSTWNGSAASVSFSGDFGVSSIVFTIEPAAPSNSCGDGLTWEYNSTTNALTISYDGSGTGVMDDYDQNPAPWDSSKGSITSVIIPNGVTHIGSAAFLECTGLTSITIPNSVTSIGSSAFNGCFGLTSITIPNSVTSIGIYAFNGCAGLTSVTIGNSVTSIGEGTFFGCDGLTSIEIPNSVMSIGNQAFMGCSGLTSVTIGNSVTSIGMAAFGMCSSLASIEIPNSVISIGDWAFAMCSSLASVTINATAQPTLGSSAFESTAEGLKIYVPAESVDDYKAAENWSDYADQIEAIAGGDEPANPSGSCGANLSWEFNPANGTLTITGTGAMYDYDDESNYAPWILSGVWESITSVIIPEGVTSIGQMAFLGCTNLPSVTIPNSVTSIGMGAFGGCSGLETVTINATTPPTLGAYAFYGTAEGLKIYVPAGSEDTYKGAWTAYAGQIEPIAGGDEPATQEITPNVDPQNPAVYYSTFYDSAKKYELPAGVEAYVADLSGANLLLTKIAEAGEVIPADNAVILKSTVTPFTLTPSDADAVTFTATNDLQGSDTQIATPANCYVLAGTDGVVGFYHYTAANLNAHKAYVVFSGSNQAPRRMPFIFDQATGVENVQGNVQSTKVIENGVLYIIKNGVKYNANGMMVK